MVIALPIAVPSDTPVLAGSNCPALMPLSEIASRAATTAN
jgi:hypothetical protein